MLLLLLLLVVVLVSMFASLALDGCCSCRMAQATSDTDFLLLSSNEVSIFFGNTFVTKTAITNISPGESFVTCLGVDHSVKVGPAKPVGHVISICFSPISHPLTW